MIQKILKIAIQHKIIVAIIIVIAVFGGYFGYTKIFNKKGAILYATTQVQKGTLIISVSGSGQVSNLNQIDIKPKVGGEIVYIGVQNGQEVKEKGIIAQVDSSDAYQAVRDAETALETAKLELEKLLEPPDELTLLQAENSLAQAKENFIKLKLNQENEYQNTLATKRKALDNLKKAYEDGFNIVSNVFLDLPGIMTNLEDMLFDKSPSNLQNNISKYINEIPTQNNQRDKAEQYRNELYNAYNLAAQAVPKNFDLYKSTSRNSNEQIIENLISETYNTTRLVAEAIKAIDNYLDFIQNTLEKEQTPLPPLMPTQQSNINSYTSKINNYLLNLLAAQNTIKDSKDTIEDSERKIKVLQQNNPLDLAAAQRNIEQSQKALDKLKKGPDELEIRAKKIAVQQKQNALEDARKNLADHYIRAPFTGIISKVNVKKGDVVSTGTIIATLITDQKIAEISLNEVDAAKVKIGQKATLTFDAFPGLTISGQVAEIDTVGTVSQGVVSYNVKINFDTQDEEVKPGMSVSAAIIIEAKPDALLIPNSAIKSQGQTNYVEMPDDNELNLAKTNPNGAAFKNPLKRQMVEIGLANDEFTEIISGLKEGDIIVTKIIQPNNSKPAQQQQNSFRIPGLPTGGGGFRR